MKNHTRKSIVLCSCFFLFCIPLLRGQTVVVTDDSTYITGQSSAVLELKSTTKGFLPPRVSSVQKLAIVSPVAGLLVYQTDGTPGYYLWTGTRWDPLVSGLGGNSAPVIKTSTATLLKTETLVLASNNITITLPVIVSADNGMSITLKNIGTYADLVQVKANGTATIDGTTALVNHTRWQAKTFIAFEGNWLLKEKENGRAITEFEVSPTSSWKTIPEILAYLALHINAPSIIRLSSGTHLISSTQTINLPFPLTFVGLSFGTTTIAAATGLTGLPMFSCATETYFKMLQFEASTLAGYGNASGEDAIWLTGTGNYHEIKDANFNGFNKAVVLKSNVELFMFDTDIDNALAAGIDIVSGIADGVVLKISETDFTNCAKGIQLSSGIHATLSIISCGFYLSNATQIGINYLPATFTLFTAISITGNTWNITGTFFQGFDFTRTDGRDANAFIQSNAGEPDHNPLCKINVINNTSTTTFTTGNIWYKANWTNTSSITSKWLVADNRITYLTQNKRDVIMMITGDLSIDAANRTVSISIVKNGISSIQYGETTFRLTASNLPFQFATTIYLQNISKNDYFEVWVRGTNNGDKVIFQDVQWLTETR